jgi:protein arginine phosphatase
MPPSLKRHLIRGECVAEDTLQPLSSWPKRVLRGIIPGFLRKQRSIVLRLGPKAGRTYATLCLRDVLGVRTENGRVALPTARSFLFVCFGNIMRSAMAAFMMRKALAEHGGVHSEQVLIMSAGVHATAGREAHEWAQQAADELGVSLAQHRAKPVTREMIEAAHCVLAMDFQNKAELLALYPEAENKIFMLSAYAENEWRYREIPDPYLGDLEATRYCARQLQICVRNLIAATILSRDGTDKPVLQR